MNTRRILAIKLSFVILVLMNSCGVDPDSFQPDTTISGAIRDSLNANLVEQDLINGSVIEALEQGYTSSYKWVIKENGEYKNNFAFSNTYLIRFANCNFFPYTLNDVVLKSGSNTIDFKVVPYIRVKDANITYNSATKIVTAKFKLEAGKPTVKLKELQLYAFSDMHVGDPVKFPIVGGGNIINRNPAIAIDPNVEYTLSIDVSKNLTTSVSDRFKFFLDGTYFFRVGALADVSGVGTVRRNYAPCVKLKLASQ